MKDWKPIQDVAGTGNDKRVFHLYCKRWNSITDSFQYSIFNNCRYGTEVSYTVGYHDHRLWSGVPDGWKVLYFIEYPTQGPEASA